jgi:C-terminal processing protease CtpA/Prc
VACAGFDFDRESGLHSAFAPGECVIEAVRRDGALFRRSDQASLRLVADAGPQSVRLQLPEERTGGIGVRFLPINSGMRVVSVVEGGPAWDAGLEVGDVIVTVDGEAVDGLEQQEFVRRMTGPEGSSVEFEILYRDPESDGLTNEPVVERVRVNRRYLDG